ncbi:MAG TPA: hypothetical protein VGH28_17175 [Polyangiaceae bacterium]
MHSKPRKLRKPHRGGHLRAVVDETVALFHRLRWVAEEAYGEEGRSVARRGVLRGLVRYGPQTVAALARVRSVSRQHMQGVVAGLVEDGLATFVENPQHVRSPLVRTTAAGAKLVERLDRVDATVLAAVARGLPPDELAAAAKLLAEIRKRFENGASWRYALRQLPCHDSRDPRASARLARDTVRKRK